MLQWRKIWKMVPALSFWSDQPVRKVGSSPKSAQRNDKIPFMKLIKYHAVGGRSKGENTAAEEWALKGKVEQSGVGGVVAEVLETHTRKAICTGGKDVKGSKRGLRGEAGRGQLEQRMQDVSCFIRSSVDEWMVILKIH